MKGPDPHQFDSVLLSPVRLAILSTLIMLKEADFMDLQATLNVTKGNLGIHGQKLEEAGYIEIRKAFQGRKPRTTYVLAARGRRALIEHVRRLELLIKEERS